MPDDPYDLRGSRGSKRVGQKPTVHPNSLESGVRHKLALRGHYVRDPGMRTLSDKDLKAERSRLSDKLDREVDNVSGSELADYEKLVNESAHREREHEQRVQKERERLSARLRWERHGSIGRPK